MVETDSPQPPRCLEQDVPLSQSLLWPALRRFFVERGPEAWRGGGVPHYVTNNPALTASYAALVLGHLRDLAAAGWRWDDAAPFTVVELGAGTGRFAFQFLSAFCELLALSPLAGTPFRYVMTDIAEANIAFWRDHPAFAGFIGSGRLDFAAFDAEADTTLALRLAGTTLQPAATAPPMVVIANYVFDGLPQDGFVIRDGRLNECLVSIETDDPVIEPGDPGLLAALRCSFTDRKLDAPPYAEPVFNALLDRYAERYEGQTLLFPHAALRCIDRLAALGAGRLLLLTADRGEVHEPCVRSDVPLGLAMHGSFSFPVNYHAIAETVGDRGGVSLTTSYRHVSLAVSAFLLGHDPASLAETRLAFQTAIEQRGPDDLFVLRLGIREHYAGLGLPQLMALLRITGWDPRLVGECAPVLWERIQTADGPQRQELVKIIERAWTCYFHIGEEQDLAFEFGMLLYGLGAYESALARFEESRRLYGEDARALWNKGLCHAALGQAVEAGACMTEAFRLEPGFTVPNAIIGKHGGD